MGARMQRLVVLTAMTVLAGAGLVALATPSSAATLSNVSWAVSNSEVGTTRVGYTYNFTTATAATISSITMTVPTGTAGTPAVGTVYGIGAGAVTLSGTTLTYAVTTPASVAAGIPIYLQITGLTNTSTAGSYTSIVTTNDVLSTLTTSVDSGTSGSVTFGASNTAVTVAVPQSLTFTNDTPSFQLLMDPTLPSLSDQTHPVVLTVTTNAGSGYTLSVSDSGLSISGSTHSIPPISTGMTGVSSGSFTADHVGVSATLNISGGSHAALQGGLNTSGDFVGYGTTPATFVSAGAPTGNSADTVTLNNRVKIDYTTPAGSYSDTITYTATPNY